MKPTVLLFDVDGTLLRTGGVGRRALDRTFARAFDREDACSHFRFDGMTDRAIVRMGLTALGKPTDEAAIDALLEVYLQVLPEEISASDPETYFVHPGMHEAIAAATRLPQVAVGLGTGNIREGARLKLARVGLYEKFPFGGFGCDHEDRVELIQRGAARGAKQLGTRPEACRVVVIGDTPKDVAAAKGIGAECVGVGTGSFSPQQLRDAGAEFAFPNLLATGALEALLGVSVSPRV